jgi:hypothetical protein
MRKFLAAILPPLLLVLLFLTYFTADPSDVNREVNMLDRATAVVIAVTAWAVVYYAGR